MRQAAVDDGPKRRTKGTFDIPTWLITSGLGSHLAQAVLEHGWNAVVTARNSAKVQDIAAHYPDTALALASDVTDRTQVAEAPRPPGASA